jgi:hypothetical protein
LVPGRQKCDCNKTTGCACSSASKTSASGCVPSSHLHPATRADATTTLVTAAVERLPASAPRVRAAAPTALAKRGTRRFSLRVRTSARWTRRREPTRAVERVEMLVLARRVLARRIRGSSLGRVSRGSSSLCVACKVVNTFFSRRWESSDARENPRHFIDGWKQIRGNSRSDPAKECVGSRSVHPERCQTVRCSSLYHYRPPRYELATVTLALSSPLPPRLLRISTLLRLVPLLVLVLVSLHLLEPFDSGIRRYEGARWSDRLALDSIGIGYKLNGRLGKLREGMRIWGKGGRGELGSLYDVSHVPSDWSTRR